MFLSVNHIPHLIYCYIFRGVAQLVAHQTGGLGAASSSLVTPTRKSTCYCKCFFQFYSPNGEFYCFAVINGFQPSDIRSASVDGEQNITVTKSQYHFCESKNITPNKVRHIIKNNFLQSYFPHDGFVSLPLCFGLLLVFQTQFCICCFLFRFPSGFEPISPSFVKQMTTWQGGGLLPPLNHNKSTVTNNYNFILYRRGELCSPVFNLL